MKKKKLKKEKGLIYIEMMIQILMLLLQKIINILKEMMIVVLLNQIIKVQNLIKIPLKNY